jgi:hypothetical protein
VSRPLSTRSDARPKSSFHSSKRVGYRNWPYNLHDVDAISKTDALNIFSKWERQNQSFSVLCFSPSFSLASKSGRVSICLDESLELSLAGDTRLRISTSEAVFSRVGPDDFPAESRNLLPEFEHGIRISFSSRQMEWYVLASLPPAVDLDPSHSQK